MYEDSHTVEPKTILIAGASGSIGEALCKKVQQKQVKNIPSITFAYF